MGVSSHRSCAGCQGERLTWVVGKVLGLTSFPLSVDDVEVDFHGHTDVLVPILGDLNKKHVLEGSSHREPDHTRRAWIPTQIPGVSTSPPYVGHAGFVPGIYGDI